MPEEYRDDQPGKQARKPASALTRGLQERFFASGVAVCRDDQQQETEEQVGPERNPENIRPVVEDFGADAGGGGQHAGPARLLEGFDHAEQFGTLAGRGAAGERGGVGRQDFGDQQRIFPCEPAQVVPRRVPTQRCGKHRQHTARQQAVQDIDLLIGLEQLFVPLVACPGSFCMGLFDCTCEPVPALRIEKIMQCGVFACGGLRCPVRGRSRVQVSPVRSGGLCPGKQRADAFIRQVDERFAAPAVRIGEHPEQPLRSRQPPVVIAVVQLAEQFGGICVYRFDTSLRRLDQQSPETRNFAVGNGRVLPARQAVCGTIRAVYPGNGCVCKIFRVRGVLCRVLCRTLKYSTKGEYQSC